MPAATPASTEGEAIVAAMLTFEDAVGWSGTWSMRWNGTDYAWKIAA